MDDYVDDLVAVIVDHDAHGREVLTPVTLTESEEREAATALLDGWRDEVDEQRARAEDVRQAAGRGEVSPVWAALASWRRAHGVD